MWKSVFISILLLNQIVEKITCFRFEDEKDDLEDKAVLNDDENDSNNERTALFTEQTPKVAVGREGRKISGVENGHYNDNRLPQRETIEPRFLGGLMCRLGFRKCHSYNDNHHPAPYRPPKSVAVHQQYSYQKPVVVNGYQPQTGHISPHSISYVQPVKVVPHGSPIAAIPIHGNHAIVKPYPHISTSVTYDTPADPAPVYKPSAHVRPSPTYTSHQLAQKPATYDAPVTYTQPDHSTSHFSTGEHGSAINPSKDGYQGPESNSNQNTVSGSVSAPINIHITSGNTGEGDESASSYHRVRSQKPINDDEVAYRDRESRQDGRIYNTKETCRCVQRSQCSSTNSNSNYRKVTAPAVAVVQDYSHLIDPRTKKTNIVALRTAESDDKNEISHDDNNPREISLELLTRSSFDQDSTSNPRMPRLHDITPDEKPESTPVSGKDEEDISEVLSSDVTVGAISLNGESKSRMRRQISRENLDEIISPPIVFTNLNNSVQGDGGIVEGRQFPTLTRAPASTQTFQSCGNPSTGYVCCPLSNVIDATLPTKRNRNQEVKCGVKNNEIIHGRVLNKERGTLYNSLEAETHFAEYPWQAVVLKKESDDNLFLCGGSLIDSRHVLSAAHCVNKYRTQQLRVRLGDWDVKDENEFYSYVDYDVERMIIHQNFNSGNLYNDIVILRLNRPVDFQRNSHIRPICLPPTSYATYTNRLCVATGWGRDAFRKGTFQNTLKQVKLPVLTSQTCESMLQRTKLGSRFKLHNSFVCAGGEEGKDACKGDGGGPLVCETSNGSWHLAGIVSWGIECGVRNVPGVYVNVANLRDWILSNT